MPMKLTYLLKHIERPLKKLFEEKDEEGVKPEVSGLPLSKQQQRQQHLREFSKAHPASHEQVLMDLRRRLLQNMKLRSPHRRVH
jgi:hypothetical protein